tara:strand:- start:4646 stop:6334 length:1689 start_codon:yes stop_codon:yes gene_type:complete
MNLKHQEAQEKLRGGYYTPPEITEFLVRWGMAINPQSILEPSCGDGAFIQAIGSCSDSLNGVDFHGVELIKQEATKARKKFYDLEQKGCSGTGVTRGEFFDFISKKKKRTLRNGADLVIGNPPYIRYQYFEHGREIAESRLEELGIKTTKHANAWLHFLAESVSVMSQNSRIAMVIPAELLHISYAADLRRWLLENLSSVTIITFEKLVFPGVQQEVVLFLGEKNQSRRKKKIKLLQFSDVSKLDQSIIKHVNKKAPVVLKDQDKWNCYFLSRKELDFFNKTVEAFGERRFEQIASIDIGIVTGANKFFCVNQETVKKWKFDEANGYLEVLPMMGRSSEVSGLEFTRRDLKNNSNSGKSCYFLRFSDKYKQSHLPSRLNRYLREGRRQELHTRFKCRIRDPWFWIPSVYASELSMFKRASEYNRLIHNTVGAYTTDTVYRVKCLENDEGITARHLAFSFINSLTFLSCELEGRNYGGGVLELVPSEVERVILPVYKCSDEEFSILDRMLRENVPIDEILDYTDCLIFKDKMDKRSISMIRKSWRKLEQRRAVRAASKVKKSI